jgi:hypothetical protein
LILSYFAAAPLTIEWCHTGYALRILKFKYNMSSIASKGFKQISAMEEAQLLFTAQCQMCDDDLAPKTKGRKSRIIQAPGAVLRH